MNAAAKIWQHLPLAPGGAQDNPDGLLHVLLETGERKTALRIDANRKCPTFAQVFTIVGSHSRYSLENFELRAVSTRRICRHRDRERVTSMVFEVLNDTGSDADPECALPMFNAFQNIG